MKALNPNYWTAREFPTYFFLKNNLKNIIGRKITTTFQIIQASVCTFEQIKSHVLIFFEVLEHMQCLQASKIKIIKTSDPKADI